MRECHSSLGRGARLIVVAEDTLSPLYREGVSLLSIQSRHTLYSICSRTLSLLYTEGVNLLYIEKKGIPSLVLRRSLSPLYIEEDTLSSL